jgi:hypothetical protein
MGSIINNEKTSCAKNMYKEPFQSQKFLIGPNVEHVFCRNLTPNILRIWRQIEISMSAGNPILNFSINALKNIWNQHFWKTLWPSHSRFRAKNHLNKIYKSSKYYFKYKLIFDSVKKRIKRLLIIWKEQVVLYCWQSLLSKEL